jgi:hypothetical protein
MRLGGPSLTTATHAGGEEGWKNALLAPEEPRSRPTKPCLNRNFALLRHCLPEALSDDLPRCVCSHVDDFRECATISNYREHCPRQFHESRFVMCYKRPQRSQPTFHAQSEVFGERY